MDGLEPFNSKLVTQTYIGYSEQNHRKNTIVRRGVQAAPGDQQRRTGGAAYRPHQPPMRGSNLLLDDDDDNDVCRIIRHINENNTPPRSDQLPAGLLKSFITRVGEILSGEESAIFFASCAYIPHVRQN